MKFEELAVFKKDVKRLLKKYRSLDADLSIVKQVLEVLPDERPPFSYRISNLGIETCVIKVKKIACQSLKGKGVNSGLRLVYAHFAAPLTTSEPPQVAKAIDVDEEAEETVLTNDEIELEDRIVFIELYHKNEKALEDRERILRHFG